MNPRSKIATVLVVSGLLFMAAGFAVVRLLLNPVENWVNAGDVDLYPPSTSPYVLRDPAVIYIINIGGDIIALSGKDPHQVGQIVEWREPENRFIDPSTGSNYWLDGSFDTRFQPDGPEPMNLERYPTRIEDGDLLIRLPVQD